jgi:hypothetical protein
MAKAPRAIEEGKLISEETAVEAARRWVAELGLLDRLPYAVLRESEPLQPLLVNAERKGYYIVPFGYSEGAILINAFDEEFQEAGVFQRPMKYISRERAVRTNRGGPLSPPLVYRKRCFQATWLA